jgi:hypothetical protein
MNGLLKSTSKVDKLHTRQKKTQITIMQSCCFWEKKSYEVNTQIINNQQQVHCIL